MLFDLQDMVNKQQDALYGVLNDLHPAIASYVSSKQSGIIDNDNNEVHIPDNVVNIRKNKEDNDDDKPTELA